MTTVDSNDELSRRDRKKLETRAALERAALTLVAERGLAGVTVEDIAEAVDVSSRTFFNYFPSKEDALIGRNRMVGAELKERLAGVPGDVPALDALHLVLREQAEQVQDQREWWLLRLRVLEQNPSLLPHLVSGGVETELVLTGLLAERAGDEGYAHLVTAVSMAAFRAVMMRWSAGDGVPTLTVLLDEAFTRLAGGLSTP
ncbi:TetR family transcriptional regulator [Nonomuraea sp. ATR24]|uniref:acyl-CoA-like ligand-binding transcription factor n=1 Tax=Nonomuraea sp. ATR24 TaxID=1676744 RepID=UPI0035C1AB64